MSKTSLATGWLATLPYYYELLSIELLLTGMGYLASFLVAAVAVSTVSATNYSPNYYCSSPRAPYHGGYHSSGGYSGGSSYRAGHVIYYYCDNGYQLYGHYRSVCYYDSRRYSSYWNYPAPFCRSKLSSDS